MTVFDFIVLALIGASVVSGALRGLVRALITGVALMVGLFVAARGYETAGNLLRAFDVVESSAAAHAGGFLLIVLVALALGFIVGRLIAGGLKRARLEWFDRVLGAVFGFVRGLAVCSIMYLALTAFPVRLSSVTQARTAPVLAFGAQMLSAFTSSDVRTRFYNEYKSLIGS
jgi:membrane protein required for colicin V production